MAGNRLRTPTTPEAVAIAASWDTLHAAASTVHERMRDVHHKYACDESLRMVRGAKHIADATLALMEAWAIYEGLLDPERKVR